ncbi:hypothetical protein PV377_39100, partial [Streptomyces ipomoeae]|uniref:hypothetical protein n=1 Tax=Streptomyces ipomoeae TaxID=103232 RepID=UPI0029ACEFD2
LVLATVAGVARVGLDVPRMPADVAVPVVTSTVGERRPAVLPGAPAPGPYACLRGDPGRVPAA